MENAKEYTPRWDWGKIYPTMEDAKSTGGFYTPRIFDLTDEVNARVANLEKWFLIGVKKSVAPDEFKSRSLKAIDELRDNSKQDTIYRTSDGIDLHPLFAYGWENAISGTFATWDIAYRFYLKEAIESKYNTPPGTDYFKEIIRVSINVVIEGMARCVFYYWLKKYNPDDTPPEIEHPGMSLTDEQKAEVLKLYNFWNRIDVYKDYGYKNILAGISETEFLSMVETADFSRIYDTKGCTVRINYTIYLISKILNDEDWRNTIMIKTGKSIRELSKNMKFPEYESIREIV